MIVVLHTVALCWFTLRSYAIEVIPASYAWSTFTGPVSGQVHEVKPWSPSSPASSYSEFEGANEESNHYGPDYVAKPHYSFAYGVENPNTGDSHGHSETRDGSHVTGEYTVMEPDGVLRRVLYTADPKNGFRASVRYVRPDGEESPNRDHGYHSGPERLPGPPPHQQQQSEYESDGGGGGDDDDEPRPFALQPQSLSLSSEHESDVDGESFAPQLPRPQPLSLNFGFNKFNDVNNNNNNNNVDDDDGDNNSDNNGDYDSSRPSGFKFPSPSSPFFKAPDAVNDSGDYGDSEKYYHWQGTLGTPPPPSSLGLSSSPSPFGLPPSASSSFGDDSGLATASSKTPFVGFVQRPSPTAPLPCRPQPPPSRAPLSSNIMSYQTGHSNSLPLYVKSSADRELEHFRSLHVDIDDDDDHDDIENYESDDSDTDNARVADVVRLLPSPKPAPSPSPTTQTSTSRTPSLTASAIAKPPAASAPSPSFRRPPSPLDALDLSPSPTMTPIQPTIIDIDV
ncbi:probable WRKY transcription factor protein 1 [Metopolophium dirhodum]|uniref:probable WRKY transcription factor protein 1 n=1 Tax=Metopolophium dirhodum TaxID=44670 RepID=UPI00298FE208|nr:probable WRKY transcription factor protein 1 [Metopolophium dirhodum]